MGKIHQGKKQQWYIPLFHLLFFFLSFLQCSFRVSHFFHHPCSGAVYWSCLVCTLTVLALIYATNHISHFWSYRMGVYYLSCDGIWRTLEVLRYVWKDMMCLYLFSMIYQRSVGLVWPGRSTRLSSHPASNAAYAVWSAISSANI